MRKIIPLFLILMMVLSLTACGKGNETSGKEEKEVNSNNIPSESEKKTESESEGEKQTDDENKQNSNESSGYVDGGDEKFDFAKCGLTNESEKALAFYEENCVPGIYLFGGAAKCSNGDLIIFEDSGEFEDTDFTVFTKADGYKKYEVLCSDNRTDYELTNYVDNKQQYYTELSVYAGTIQLLPSVDTAAVFASAEEYISSRGINLLEYCEVKPEDVSCYEISSYTEYSGKIDPRYLNTTFMQPETRKFEYLVDYADKISYWTVGKVVNPVNYLDANVFVQFDLNFDHNDYQKLLDCLVDYSLVSNNGKDFAAAKEGMLNGAEGRMAVYSMPFSLEGDNWYDDYKLSGYINKDVDMLYPYGLRVSYQHSFLYDGGTNAYYYVSPDGLWRKTNDEVWHMIEKDGNRLTYDFYGE